MPLRLCFLPNIKQFAEYKRYYFLPENTLLRVTTTNGDTACTDLVSSLSYWYYALGMWHGTVIGIFIKISLFKWIQP